MTTSKKWFYVLTFAVAGLLPSLCNAQRSYWYQDLDIDGYGNPLMRKQQKAQPRGYVRDNTDCNDLEATIHPGSNEVCNGIDDNCTGAIDEGLTYTTYYLDSNGDGYGDDAAIYTTNCTGITPIGYSRTLVPVADLSLKDTGIPIIKNFTSGALVDLGYTGGQRLTPRDITIDPVYSIAQSTGFHSYTYVSGQTCQGDHPNSKRDTMYLGGSGSWYNWQGTDDIKGAGCKTCPQLNGKNIDFFNSAIEFTRKSKAEIILSANIDDGTLDELKWKLSRAHAISPLQKVTVFFGQEESLTSSGVKGDVNKYISITNPWIDSVHKWYPGSVCYVNAAPVFSGGKLKSIWNPTLTLQTHGDGVTMYVQQDECTSYTGDVIRDTSDLTSSLTVTRNWYDQLSATFPGKKIMITQFNASETFSDGGSIVYPGQFISSDWVVRQFANMLTYNATHSNIISTVVWQNVKNITGGNVLDVNGYCWQQINKLFGSDGTYINVTCSVPGLLIFGVKVGATYKLVVENHSGRDVALPKSVSLDGYYFSPVWTGDFMYSEDLLSKTINSYVPAGTVKGYSVGYCTFSVPIVATN